MFKGSLPPDALSIISEITDGWDCKDIYVGCSGNFTIERSLSSFRFHSNDVSMYSCTLGRFFSRQKLEIKVSKYYEDKWGWLSPYLDTPEGCVATVMLCTKIFDGFDKVNTYFDRMRLGYEVQFPSLHKATVEKLLRSNFTVSSFYAGDAVSWCEEIDGDVGFISYPPFFTKGYEKLNEKLDKVFEWERPEYPIMDADRRLRFFNSIISKRLWIIGTHVEMMEFEPHLKGICKTSSRGAKIYVYGSNGSIRRIGPKMGCKAIQMPRLMAGETIGNSLQLLVLTGDQFHSLRSQHINVDIKPAMATLPVGVLVDGYLVGCFAFNAENGKICVPLEYSPFVYMLSDFSVSGTDYPRLSKLVLYAALSKEARLLAEKMTKRRVNGLMTTGFSDNMISMKYRGILNLTSRFEEKNNKKKYRLNYCGILGKWNLDEGFAEWKKKHGKLKPK